MSTSVWPPWSKAFNVCMNDNKTQRVHIENEISVEVNFFAPALLGLFIDSDCVFYDVTFQNI